MCRRLLVLSALLVGLARALFAWDYEGHRTVNQLALTTLPGEFPAFVQAKQAVERIAFLAGEPDRWRNVPDLPFRHAGGPDHYLDVEDLSWTDSSLTTIPEFRYVYVGQISLALEKHPERFPVLDPAKNKDHTREFPGFLPWAIAENYGRLKSSFTYLKAYEQFGGTPAEIENARANVIYSMAVLGHFVADAAQPLHTTRFHNGWFGDNPHGYTTSKTFHALIDGTFFNRTGGLNLEALRQEVKPARLVGPLADDPRDPIFAAATRYIAGSNALVEPLYQLEKDGKLSPESPLSRDGRKFLEARLVTAAEMLGSLWYTAWHDAPPDTWLQEVLAKRAKP